MSIVSSLNIARQALSVNQMAITVVSNNIANVDTDGYSKLKVSLGSVVNTYNSAGDSATIEANSLSGVEILKIKRYSDFYLQSTYWDKNSTYSYYNTYSTIASNIEDMVNELNDTGLSSALSDFYDAASALSNDADNLTLRQNYVSAAENVCSIFNSIHSSLTSQQEALVGTSSDVSSSDIAANVNNLNDLLDQLAQVNDSIITTNYSDGSSSSALLDQRDSLVSQITSLVNVDAKENANGTITISIGNKNLVDGAHVKNYLSVANEDNTATADTSDFITKLSIKDAKTGVKTDITDELTGGSIKAILDVCGTADSNNLTINSLLSDLNDMASAFAGVMNEIQTGSSIDSSGNTVYAMCLTSDGSALQSSADYEMFVSKDGSSTITAGNIAVSSDIINNPYYVAAARTTGTDDGTTITPTDPTAVGNSSNMTKIIAVRTDSSYYAGTALEGTTLEGALTRTVTGVGSDVSNLEGRLTTSASVLTETESNLNSIRGVNLDEELSDLIIYQRAYQAAARIFSTCNELLEELVNLGK